MPPPTDPGRRLLFVLDPLLGHVTIHIRGLVFRDLLQQHGWTVQYLSRRPERWPTKRLAIWWREQNIVRQATGYDLVYLLKVPSLSLVRQLKRRTGAKIIFDLTDALWLPHHRSQGWQDLEKILAEVDVVFSENQYICEYGRRYARTVLPIPAYCPIENFERARPLVPPRHDGRVIIGWIGSPSTATALAAVRDPLEKLFARYAHLELRVLGCAGSQLPGFQQVRVTCRPDYAEETMIREVLNMDIGIFPPPRDLVDYEIRGALKGMIYMAGGVPVVFQNAGDCRNFIRDGDNGMLASTPDEWHGKLQRLVEAPELRRQMGRRGRETVQAEHSLSAVCQKLEEALLQVRALPAAPCSV